MPRSHRGPGADIKFILFVALLCLAVSIIALYVGGVNVFEWIFELIAGSSN